MRKIYTFLALCLIFMGVTSAMAADGGTFKDFTIDLKVEKPTLPDGVEQVTHPGHGAKYNDKTHGWQWFAARFSVDGPVKITIQGCEYAAENSAYIENGKGEKLITLDTRSIGCSGFATYEYKGEAGQLTVYCGQYCPLLKVEAIEASDPNVKEKSLYKTKFQDWDAMKSSTTATSIKKTTTDGQELTFSLSETEVNPTGTQAKFTNECITEGYLMAAKTATPYIKTSTLANVTSVKFVHAATGSNRGWGLKVKGDGDADWVTLSNEVTAEQGKEVEVNVKRTNVQLWFYNLNPDQNAYMTSLEIKGMVEVKPRTFTSFAVDFRHESKQPVIVSQNNTLPEGVSIDAGTFHDAQHGFSNVKMTVPVDGPVRFSIGSCKYNKKGATVSIDGGEPIAIAISDKCDNGFGEFNYSDVYTYNEEKPATLTFDLGDYCPFFKAETCDYTPSVTVAYYNTDGKRIGEETVAGGSKLDFKYSSADVTMPSGHAFRGWFNGKGATALKVEQGTVVNEDINLYAKVTAIETAMVGTHFEYDLTKKNWYVDDHELIDIENGNYHNNHGWIIGANGTIQLQVAGKCYVNIKNCQYSAQQTVTVKSAGVKEIAKFDLPVATDGETTTIKYDGSETTLTFTFPAGNAYIHGIEVYNVENFLAYDENTHYYEIAPNDAAGLLLALKAVKEGDKIFLPNGTYDLGETVLTTISANNVSIIGESMDNTIIRNAPDKTTEGIGTTAIFVNNSKNLYMQDLTLRNDLDYYAVGGTARAVCLQDKGENTICKNVKMISHQDTYYSNKASKFYWEDSELHGCVDYVCGDGDVVFNRSKFVNESRAKDKKSGSVVICAPNTSESCTWGYVFLDCNISSLCNDFTFARAWGGKSKAQFIRTQILDNSLASSRFTIEGMNVAADKFKEYATTNPEGSITTPKSNVIKFTHSSGNNEFETVLSDDEAAQYTVANIFGEWAPDKIAAQVTDKDKGSVFLVDGKITTDRPTEGKFRIANTRGGFGPEVDASTATAIETVTFPTTMNAPKKFFNDNKIVIIKNGKTYNVAGQELK